MTRREQVLDALARHGGSHVKAAAELGIHPSTVKQHMRLQLLKETLNGKGAVVSQQFGIKRGEKPAPLPGEITIGRSILSDGNGDTIATWDKTKIHQATVDMRTALKEVFNEYQGKAELGGSPVTSHDDLLQVYPLADQHVGLLAWGKETGEDYDLAIGQRRLREVSEQLVISAPAARNALILGLGDFYHVDDQTFATPASRNRLDGDGRHFKILKTGLLMQQDLISLALERHDHVTVVNLPGNHDPHAKMVLDIGLEAFYHAHPRVTVVAEPSRWFFHSWGSNLLGATHGDECKPEAMVMRMAEHPEWSASPHRVFFYGHFHRDQSKPVGGCRTVCVPTITARDAWGAGKGFVSPKAMIGTTFHITDGEIASQRVNV